MYTAAGRSALMKATTTLIVEATNIDTGSIDGLKFDHSSIPNLNGYTPYHDDLDLSSMAIVESHSEQCQDPFIVEKIVKKRFNASKAQYEYFIKWVGYSSRENTWELLSNKCLKHLSKNQGEWD